MCFSIINPHSRAPKKNTSRANEVSPQDSTHLMQNNNNNNNNNKKQLCYQRECASQDQAGSWTTQRPPDHGKETQSAVVWSCLPVIRSGKKHLARHGEKGQKTRQTEEEVGRQHQRMGKPGFCQVPEGSGEQGKLEVVKSSVVPQRPSWLRDI